jgi:hypothetical protein
MENYQHYRDGKAKGKAADGYSGGNYHRFLKKYKLRIERRKAKRNPECIPAYRKYYGYEL